MASWSSIEEVSKRYHQNFLLCNNNGITACLADLFNSFCEEVYSIAYFKVVQQHTIDKVGNSLLSLCGQIICMYVCNSERIIKIGQYLRKLCSDEKESSFFDSWCSYSRLLLLLRCDWCVLCYCTALVAYSVNNKKKTIEYFYIGGAAAEYVTSLKHMGHVLWNDCSVSEDVSRCQLSEISLNIYLRCIIRVFYFRRYHTHNTRIF